MASEHPSNTPESQDLRRWLQNAERDAEYFELASRALLGNEEAQAELKYRFPWHDPQDNPHWKEIPSSEVRRLVALALSEPGEVIVAHLKLHLQIRSVYRAASQWAISQAKTLKQLREAV